ncbi:MAG: hypothetical protein M3394_00845 [Actinomycetota bacterium]|nr:hypothetical protein [Actinomycetota bacterium]
MAAPDYVPIAQNDRPREPLGTPGHDGWTATCPGDLTGFQPSGRLFGNQGPDQGYGLVLAERFHDRLLLTEGEDEHDVMAGSLGVGLARASLFGRAPVVYDLELAFTLFGFLGGAPIELVTFRKPLFESASHHYHEQRAIADRVPEETLRLTPVEVRDLLPSWRELITTTE